MPPSRTRTLACLDPSATRLSLAVCEVAAGVPRPAVTEVCGPSPPGCGTFAVMVSRTPCSSVCGAGQLTEVRVFRTPACAVLWLFWGMLCLSGIDCTVIAVVCS